jgi:FMN phosphatase YigB (HAD superfamily)
LPPDSVWHVGDSLESDVAGAKGAGLRSVWLNRRGLVLPEGAPRPDHEIGSLQELVELLNL